MSHAPDFAGWELELHRRIRCAVCHEFHEGHCGTGAARMDARAENTNAPDGPGASQNT